MQDFIVVGETRALVAQALLALHTHAPARCLVIGGRHSGLLRWSPMCARHVKINFYGADDDRFVDTVNQHAQARPGAILVPADCQGNRMINRVRGRLHAAMMPAPDAPMLACMNDKWRFHQFCMAHGVPVPPARYFADKHAIDFVQAARQFGLPFVVKPLDQAVSTGVVIVTSEADFHAMVADNDAYCFAPLIVQRHIAGCDVGLNLLSLHGTVAAMAIQRRVNSTVHFFAHAELEAIGHTIARASGYHGVMNIDARIEEGSGRVYLFESNPRLWRSLAASVWCGVNFAGACVDRTDHDRPAPAPIGTPALATGSETDGPARPHAGDACRRPVPAPVCLSAGVADVYYHPVLRPAQWRHVFFDSGRQGRMARLMMTDPYLLASSVRPASMAVWQFLNRHLLGRRVKRIY